MASPSNASTPESVQLLLNGPAGTPPAGVTPNFDNPPNLNNTFLVGTLVLCLSFATVAVLIRLYTKLFLIRSVAYEDYTILIAWIGQIGQTIPSGMIPRYGSGVHIWNVQMKVYFKMLYWVNISSILYCPTIFFIKFSILLQYLRIFHPTRQGNPFLFVGVHVCIWSIFLFYFVDLIFEIIMCLPREKIWNPLITTGHCFDSNASFQATGIFNVLSDSAILLLPIRTIWRLKVSLRKKIGIIAIFSAGFFACVTSIIRSYYTWKILESQDVTYNICRMGLWAYAEIAIGIIVTCLPISPRFFQFVGPKLSKTFSLRSKSGTKVESKPNLAGPKNNVKVGTKFEWPFTKDSAVETSNSSSSQQAHYKVDYNTLDEIESQSTKRELMNSGHQGIRVDRTTHIELGPNPTHITSSDSAILQRERGW